MKVLNGLKLGLTGILLASSLSTNKPLENVSEVKSVKVYTKLENQIKSIVNDRSLIKNLDYSKLIKPIIRWEQIFSNDSTNTIVWDAKTDSILEVRPTKFTTSQNTLDSLMFDSLTVDWISNPFSKFNLEIPFKQAKTQREVDIEVLNGLHQKYLGVSMPKIKNKRPIKMAYGKKYILETGIKRISPYLDYKLKRLNEKNLGSWFVVIPIIESGYNQRAVSSAKATGAYQIMYTTGKYLGLAISIQKEHGKRIYDYRRHHIASFEKASDYMKKIFDSCNGFEFLSVAKYNYGPNRKIFRNITNSKDALDVFSSLNNETKNYLPEVIAVQNVLGSMLKEHYWMHFKPKKIKIVKLSESIKRSEIETKLNVNETDFFENNNQYLQTERKQYTLSKGKTVFLPSD